MRHEIEKNKHYVGYQKDVRYMKVAEELLARMTFSDFYLIYRKALRITTNVENVHVLKPLIKPTMRL